MILMHGSANGVVRGESAAFQNLHHRKESRAKRRSRILRESTKKQLKGPRQREKEAKLAKALGRKNRASKKRVPKSWDNSGNGVIPDFSDEGSEGTEEAKKDQNWFENELTDSDKRAEHLLNHRSLLAWQQETCSSEPELKGLAYCRHCLIKPQKVKLSALPPANLSPKENPVGVGVDMKLYIREKGAVFSGLASCDSQWCMNCVSKKKEKHVRMISDGIEGARRLGYGLYFLTPTVKRSDDINDLSKQLQAGRTAVMEALRTYKKRGINCEYVWAVDVTFQNKQKELGIYHLHLHMVLAIESNPNVREVQRLVAQAWSRHTTGIATERCQDVRRIWKNEGISRYIAKFQGMALELTNGIRKKGRAEGNMSLVGLMELGMNGTVGEREWARKTYLEFLIAMKRKKTLQPSQGWKNLEKEAPEEEAKEEENIIEVSVPEEWHKVMAEYHHDVAFVAWWNVHIVPDARCLKDFDLLLEMHTYDWEYNTARWKGPDTHLHWWQRTYLRRWIEMYEPQEVEGSRLTKRLSKIIDRWKRRKRMFDYRSNIARRVIRKMKKKHSELNVQQLRKLSVEYYPFPTYEYHFYSVWNDILREEGISLKGHLDEVGVSSEDYHADFHAHAKQYKLFE